MQFKVNTLTTYEYNFDFTFVWQGSLSLLFFEALNCCGYYNFYYYMYLCSKILILVWINFKLLTT